MSNDPTFDKQLQDLRDKGWRFVMHKSAVGAIPGRRQFTGYTGGDDYMLTAVVIDPAGCEYDLGTRQFITISTAAWEVDGEWRRTLRDIDAFFRLGIFP